MSFLIIIFISINTIVSAKYILDNDFEVANLNIDRIKPIIELIDIKNSNVNYDKYANKTHKIIIKINIIERNLKSVNLNQQYIEVKVGEKIIKLDNLNVKKIEDKNENHIYEIELNKIDDNGNLVIIFKQGVAIDFAEWKNDEKIVNTNILIDNVAPQGKFTEKKITDGKVEGTIQLSEKIREFEGWKFSEDKLKLQKEFTNNISYELPITDFAGNLAMIPINITQATYLKIIYASHNSEVGWSFGYGNYDIAGKKAIEKNAIYKTEALAFSVSGNVDKDFVQANAYVYSYWGEGSIAKCLTYGNIYKYGYNPSQNTFKSMMSNDLINLNGSKYFQFGGSGINKCTNTDINGNNPISWDTHGKYKFGISGLKLKLKEYSQYSIVYQILQESVGWIQTRSNGEVCMYKNDLPISAFRMAVVPKSEKQYVINMWDKDIGTKNIK